MNKRLTLTENNNAYENEEINHNNEKICHEHETESTIDEKMKENKREN